MACSAVLRLVASLIALSLCSSPAAAQPNIDPDARIQQTLRLLGTGRECRAHASLAWLRARFPHGILPGDEAFVQRRYSEAFTAYRALASATRLDEPVENARLEHVATLAAKGSYATAIVALGSVQDSDDLTALISGGIYFAAGKERDAESTWVSGVGAHIVPGGSSPYVGASLSILFVLDGTVLAHTCAKK
jgi:hypothetical protein